jgi:hypothetical protein
VLRSTWQAARILNADLRGFARIRADLSGLLHWLYPRSSASIRVKGSFPEHSSNDRDRQSIRGGMKRAWNADCADPHEFPQIKSPEPKCSIRVNPFLSAFIRAKRSFLAAAAN